MMLYDVRETEPHFSWSRSAQSISIGLKKQSFLLIVVINSFSSIISETSNVVASKPFDGNSLEEICIFIPKLDPADGTSFLPIKVLVTKES